MAASGKGYALTGLLQRGSSFRKRGSLLVKASVNAAGSTVIQDLVFVVPAGVNYTLTASGGTYTLAGGTAILLRSKQLVGSGGTYVLTGQSSTILRSKLLTASGGSYTLTGSSATITYTAVTGYTLTAQGGSYTLTGASATLLKSKKITASGGTYTFTGSSATISRNRLLTASGGTYTIAGSSGSYSLGYLYPPPQYVLSGIVYGPGGIYTGTLDAVDKSIKLDLTTGKLVKPLSNKIVLSL